MTINEFKNKPVEKITECPLCGGMKFSFVQNWDINDLMRRWEKERGFSPIPDSYKNHDLIKGKCADCGLYSYNYALRDDYPGFYERLVSEEHQYYHPARTEYSIFKDDVSSWLESSPVPGVPAVLEVGCGNGFLLEQLTSILSGWYSGEKHINRGPTFIGTEFNKVCLENCKRKGLLVLDWDLKRFLDESKPGYFNAIMTSQVMEHIIDIRGFLDDVNALLSRRGGRYYAAVPNPEQISVTGNSILNIAPHHQIDFSGDTFDWIAAHYGWNIKWYRKEPLTQRIYRKYKDIAEGIKIAKDASVDADDFARVSKTNFGHTHMVCFEKSK